MSYIPHTSHDIEVMLSTIGVETLEHLFDEIPAELRCQSLENVPMALTEIEVSQLLKQRANQQANVLCFAGAGAYNHHIPAAVWQVATRGEFYSAYTPYQAEASQGTLQVLYEYQTMISRLTGMDASNASLYDGASALAEAILMAVRLNKGKAKKILIPRTVHPLYRAVAKNLTVNQGIELIEVDYDANSGTTALTSLTETNGVAALVIPHPNFFGQLEAVHELTDWAHQHKILVIALANPTALALFSAPNEWGTTGGADMVCGEGQPLGVPLASGGPYFGFLCCKKEYVRQMPGRIVGRTVDKDGKIGYTLTLQAREQHIRRSKATSNICTNQGLMVTAATIYLSLLGTQGLTQVARACYSKTRQLVDKLTSIQGVETVFNAPYFHEQVIRLPQKQTAEAVLAKLAEQRIIGGVALAPYYPELADCILVCATEMSTEADIDSLINALKQILV